MYPKLRRDAYLTPTTPAGLLVAIDGHGHRLQGRNLYPLLERLQPYLNGQHHVQDIVGHLDQSAAQVIRTLLQQLQELGAVRDQSVNRSRPLEESVIQMYANSLAYLERFTAESHRAFEQVLQRPICLVGSGSVMRTLAPALWESGVRHGQVILAEDDPLRAELSQQVQAHQRLDPAVHWLMHERPTPAPFALAVIAGTPEMITAWSQWPELAGVPILPVALGGTFCTIGPVQQAWSTCQTHIRYTPPLNDTWSAYSVVGARAAIEAFQRLAGFSGQTAEHLLCIDTQHLGDTRYPARPAAPREFVNAFNGALESIDEEDLLQLPLHVTRVRARGGNALGIAAGADAQEAWAAALLGGLGLLLPPSPPESSGRGAWTPAWGRSLQEMIALGRARAAESSADPDHMSPVEDPTQFLDVDAAHWWKTLSERHLKRLQVRGQWHGTQAVVQLVVDDQAIQAAGSTLPSALKRALLQGLAGVQAQITEPVFSPLFDRDAAHLDAVDQVRYVLDRRFDMLIGHGFWIGWVQEA